MAHPTESTPEDLNSEKDAETYDVVIVGAGAAGVGVAIAVQHTGIENYLLVCLLYTSPSPRD